jgi:hypothetical protein
MDCLLGILLGNFKFIECALLERTSCNSYFFTFIISASSILGLYSLFGFEKIMGLGHIFWVPLLFFVSASK